MKSKRFPCGGCKKAFASIISLKRHFKTFHMQEKPYSCQACDKSYTQSHSLKTHVKKVHEGLKLLWSNEIFHKLPRSSAGIKNEFTPDEVDRMTPNVENETLKTPKLYSCQACDKSFTQSGSFKRHILTVHRGQTPYYCQACDKSYTQSSSLKTHILTFHRGQKYSCQACDKSFTRSHTLKTHIQKVHEGLKLPQSSAGIKNEFTPDEVDRMTPNVENETLKKPKQYSCQACDKRQIHLEAILGALNSEFGL